MGYRDEVMERAGLSVVEGNGRVEKPASLPLPKAAPFPIGAMPKACARLIEETVACMECAPDLVAVPMLTALSSAIGASRIVEIKRGWREGAALFTAVVASPGSMKSPAADVANKPVSTRERENKREHVRALERYDQKHREWEAEKRQAMKDHEPAPEEPERPHMSRCKVSDTTVEALVGILEHNPRGLLVYRDELSGWVKSMDQYKSKGSGADRDHWLSIYSNQEVIVDRKSQNGEPIMLTRPFASVCGGIQPYRLGDLGGAAEDGMMDRFLFAYPDTHSVEDNDEEITELAERRYANLYDELADLAMPTDEHGAPNPKPLRMSPDARQAFRQAVNGLAAETSRPGFPAVLEGPWAKMRGQLARLSLILAVCRHAEEAGPAEEERVEAGDVLKALALLDYFKAHARRVYGRITVPDPGDMLASDVADWIEQNGENSVGSVGQNGASPTQPTQPMQDLRWEGTATELYEGLREAGCRALPARPKELSQAVVKIGGRADALDVARGWRGDEKVLRIRYFRRGRK